MPDESGTQSPVASMSYEQARDELGKVVSQLEAGTTTLEESLKLWERGEELVAVCEKWLDNARERIEAVRKRTTNAEGADTKS